MISKDHKHHQKPFYHLHQNEIGLWGIGCTALNEFYISLKTSNPSLNIGYYDVKHDVDITNQETLICSNNVELHLNKAFTSYQINLFFNDADLLLINGNHHSASKMILILDGKKDFKPNETNLKNTIAIFYNNQTHDLANNLIKPLEHAELIEGTDFNTINQYLKHFINGLKTPIYGVILTGGESTRMQQNKSLLVYHQKAQWLHLYELLEAKCEQTYVSCTEKNASLYNQKPLIQDSFIGYGPLSGILSALMLLKNKAILVLACDLPLINQETIQQLIEARDSSKMATTFLNQESNFLEPLITIYEPRALSIMLNMLAQGYTCPRKILMQNDIKIIHPKNPNTLKNINFPDEKEQVMEIIKKL